MHFMNDLSIKSGVDIFKVRDASSEIFKLLNRPSTSKVHNAIREESNS